MTSIEAYKKLLLRVNKNDTNTDIDISKGEFVLLYNEQKNRWLNQEINKKDATLDVQDLSGVQVKYASLEKDLEGSLYTTFKLPSNFFNYISSYSVCSQGECKGVRIFNYPYKPLQENMLLEDTNSDPSFEFEETIVDLSQGSIYVHKKDFNVDEVFLNYYREPGLIDIAGYIKLDGNESSNIDPDIDDIYVDQIIDRCASEIIRRYENPEGFQLAADRELKEE